MAIIPKWITKADAKPIAKRPEVNMRDDVLALALGATGFLAAEEGMKLFELARELAVKAP